MKYWNKDKEIRRRCWTKVPHPRIGTSRLFAIQGGWVRGTADIPTAELKKWCQQQSSKGKFYHYYGSDSWWFEKSEDAMMFALRWS